MDLSDQKRSDYIFNFESHGTSFLFEDIVVVHYTPDGDSLTLYRDGKIRVFLSKEMVTDMNAEGLTRSIKETKDVIESLEKNIAESTAKFQAYRQKKDISLDDAKDMLGRLALICRQYKYFDINYWDSAFKKAEEDAQMSEVVKLIQDLKNVMRAKMQAVFFDTGDQVSCLSILIEKVSERFGISKERVSWYTEKEILSLFSGDKVSDEAIIGRQKAYVYFKDEKGESYLYAGNGAGTFINRFDVAPAITNVFKGKAAHGSGKVKGQVMIIRRDYTSDAETRRRMAAMKPGWILVSEVTDPDYIDAMKKSAAVVTDVGGMLSHAAITSRELNIPCIVGTGTASKILKEGDMVELDMQKGTVTRL